MKRCQNLNIWAATAIGALAIVGALAAIMSPRQEIDLRLDHLEVHVHDQQHPATQPVVRND